MPQKMDHSGQLESPSIPIFHASLERFLTSVLRYLQNICGLQVVALYLLDGDFCSSIHSECHFLISSI
ncbi:unnamed protein product, partial [Bubo scandiacus]